MLMTIVEALMIGVGLMLIGMKACSVMIGTQVSSVRSWLGSTKAAQYHDLAVTKCTAQADAWLAARKKAAKKPSPAAVHDPKGKNCKVPDPVL
jgi:hypothetical protein